MHHGRCRGAVQLAIAVMKTGGRTAGLWPFSRLVGAENNPVPFDETVVAGHLQFMAEGVGLRS